MTCDLVCKTFSLMFFLVPHPPLQPAKGCYVVLRLRCAIRHGTALCWCCTVCIGKDEQRY